MPLTQPLLSLIADQDGTALTSFLTKSADEWATEHMARRYSQSPPTPEEGPRHMARRCYDHLKYEHGVIRGWFTDTRKFSLLLQSPFTAGLRKQPVGNGIGWDFRATGEAEPRMMQFKQALIYCQRAADQIPPDDRTLGNLHFSGLVRLVRAAYRGRAELHNWRPVMGREGEPARDVVKLSGEELATRWVAFRSMAFMVQVGADPFVAWAASKCGKVFGPIDENVSDTFAVE